MFLRDFAHKKQVQLEMEREEIKAFLKGSGFQPTEEHLSRAEAIYQRAAYESVDWLLNSMLE
jgi:hypothetical protein